MNIKIAFALCLGLAVAGCDEGTGTTPVSRGQSDAAQLSLRAIGKPDNASPQAAVLHVDKLRYDSAMKILERMCGPRYISNFKGTYNSRLKEQQRHRDKIPQITDCYAKRGAEAWDMRIAQRAYIDAARPVLEPTAKVMNKSFLRPGSISSELTTYQREVAEAPRRMQRGVSNKIRDLTRKRNANRDSWARAAAGAAPAFGRTLNSGTNQSTLTPIRTASLYTNASPAAVIAMDAMDRTVFGDAAVNQRILNEAAAAGRYSRQASGSITLTETQYCQTRRRADGSCPTFAEQDAQDRADADARHAAYTSDALRRRAEMAEESRRIAEARAATYPPCWKSGCR